MDKAALISRVEDELDKAEFLMREARKNADLTAEFALPESASFQAGLAVGYQYAGGVLLQILLDNALAEQSKDA